MNIPTPYLVFLGDAQDYKQAKTAFGIAEWRPELCVGQMKLDDCAVDLGLKNLTQAEAVAAGAKTFLIAISPFSTTLPASYIEAVLAAIECGMHVANPLHGELPEVILNKARERNVEVYNFRHRDIDYPKGTGEKRPGLRLLTVGTDCACGKKFTALSISRALTTRNVPNTFRSTGQTGFLISQSGINNDTIKADFLSGAAEWLTPANSPDHWDVVEGQGALSHPSFGAGSLSLIYGTQPDAIVMCHEPGRQTQRGVKMPLLDPFEEIKLVTMMAKRTNPNAQVVALSLFTKYVSSIAWTVELINRAEDMNIFVFDPSDDSVNPGAFDSFIAYLAEQSADNAPNLNKHGARYV